MSPRLVIALVAATALLAAAGCGDGEDGGGAAATGQRFPDVTAVEVARSGGAYDLAVTISSPYDSPERYADGWRVLAPDGAVLAAMTLGHDHASEQPFTRTQSGVEVPPGIDAITVEGHDLANGYGGATRTVALPGR